MAAPVRSRQHGAHREVLTAAEHPGFVASQVLHSVAAADSADCELVLDERVAPLPTPTITEQKLMKDTRVQPPARGRAHDVPHDTARCVCPACE